MADARYGYSEAQLKQAYKDIYTNISEQDQQAFIDELKKGDTYAGGESSYGQGSYDAGYYVGQDFIDRLKAANDPNNADTKERNRKVQLAKLAIDMPGLDSQTILAGKNPILDSASSVLAGKSQILGPGR